MTRYVYDIRGNTPEENPLFPLPPDYETLSAQGQKEARLAVVSDHRTPYNLTMAWAFFRRYYLMGIPPEYDHLSFYKGFVKSPPFHYQLIYDLGRYPRNAQVAPRGSSKSTLISKEVPLLLMLTRTGRFEINLGLATERLMERTVGEVRRQLEDNPLIVDDFGRMKPKKGKGKWSDSTLELLNGNSLYGLSIMGKKRGLRPNLFIFDDPEFDKDKTEAQEVLIQQFDTILTKQVLPMMKRGCGVYWIGTMVSRKAFLYKMFSGEDSRFEGWNRVLYVACRKEKNKYVDLLWPEGMDENYLREQELLIGSANFAGEYLGSPASHTERLLQIHPELNTYTVEGVESRDAYEVMDPFDESVKRTVTYCMKKYEKGSIIPLSDEPVRKEEPYVRWVSRMTRMMFIDYAMTTSSLSDYTSIMVVGMCKDDVVWPLDLFVGRLDPAYVNDKAMAMAEKWKVHMICPESLSVQYALADSLRTMIKNNDGVRGLNCSVVLLDYGGRRISKGERIAGLQKYFNAHRIKLPTGKIFMDSWSWRQLYQQINDFTLDLSMLSHDDAIDSLAMFQYSPYAWGKTIAPEPMTLTPLDRLASGDLYYHSPYATYPVAASIPLQEIPLEVILSARGKALQKNNPLPIMALGGNHRRSRKANRFDIKRPMVVR